MSAPDLAALFLSAPRTELEVTLPGGGYENAPATLLVATCCACCARPLVDAVSVETGVGPECRKKHGYADAQQAPDYAAVAAAVAKLQDEDLREWFVNDGEELGQRVGANRAVHAIAAQQDGPDVAVLTELVAALGFTKLAARIARRVGVIVVTQQGDLLVVKAPFNEAFNDNARRVPGSRWDKLAKCRTVPVAARRQLWEALQASFPPGTMVQGREGLTAL